MLKGYEILESIPAYDFSRCHGDKTKDEIENYKAESTKECDKEKIVSIINRMINHYDIEEDALFVLKAILNDGKLLNKTKIVCDGSFRNFRIWTCKPFDNYGYYDIYEDNKFTTLDISWRNMVDKKIDFWGEEWKEFKKSIKQKDIIKVLNNIEEIFIQP